MDGGLAQGRIALAPAAMSALMPLHVIVGACGSVMHMGPTAARIMGDQALGRSLFDLFILRRLRVLPDMAALAQVYGQQLKLIPRHAPQTKLQGLAVPCGAGALVNLSFGSHLDTAVRDLGLTVADFVATDLAVDQLYLIEAKAALMAELGRLNGQLFAAKSAAETAALTDTLTGLVNRRGFDLHLARALGEGGPFTLMQVDLDHFKQVNDTHGHAAGDAVLKAAAQAMLRATRGGDIVARLGGDEFAMILPGLTSQDTATTIASRLIRRLELPVLHDGVECRISGSIGIALALPGEAAASLMARTDQALYAAKRAGRGRAEVAAAGG